MLTVSPSFTRTLPRSAERTAAASVALARLAQSYQETLAIAQSVERDQAAGHTPFVVTFGGGWFLDPKLSAICCIQGAGMYSNRADAEQIASSLLMDDGTPAHVARYSDVLMDHAAALITRMKALERMGGAL